MPYDLSLTPIFTGAAASSKSMWSACDFYDKVVFNCNTTSPQFWTGSDTCNPLPGLDPSERYDGVVAFMNRIWLWSGNRLKCCDAGDYSTWIPVGETVSSVHCTLQQFAGQPVPGGSVTFFVNESPQGLQTGQFMRIDNGYQTNFYQVTAFDAVTFTITATLLNLTGVSVSSTTFPAGTPIDTIPANMAGEYVNSGDRVNGPIYQVIPMGDEAYIFKNRSIQLMQSANIAGFDSVSEFAFMPTITDEGMLGKYSWTRSTNEIIYFFGNRELYAFSGGKDLRPVATQHTKQVYAELDRANVDLIRLFHQEDQNEIWLVYPVTGAGGAYRVLIYNYRWDTCSIDDYDPVKHGAVTALGAWDYQLQETWLDLVGTWAEQTQTWEELAANNSVERLTIMGLNPQGGTPSVNVYGGTYSRGGDGYTCLCETQDYDFGDPLAFKYVDTQFLSVEVLTPEPSGPWRLYVQVGARANLDSNIEWSASEAVEVAGNGMRVTQTNIRKAGRFIRLRFWSDQADVSWKISSFRIMGRIGGTR